MSKVSAAAGLGLDVFLWTLQCAGIGIALVGLGRERWLAARRR